VIIIALTGSLQNQNHVGIGRWIVHYFT